MLESHSGVLVKPKSPEAPCITGPDLKDARFLSRQCLYAYARHPNAALPHLLEELSRLLAALQRRYFTFNDTRPRPWQVVQQSVPHHKQYFALLVWWIQVLDAEPTAPRSLDNLPGFCRTRAKSLGDLLSLIRDRLPRPQI